jgi:hypothetical protein
VVTVVSVVDLADFSEIGAILKEERFLVGFSLIRHSVFDC